MTVLQGSTPLERWTSVFLQPAEGVQVHDVRELLLFTTLDTFNALHTNNVVLLDYNHSNQVTILEKIHLNE